MTRLWVSQSDTDSSWLRLLWFIMRTVEAADKIIVLADGKVAEEGTPAELFAKENSLFRRMTQLQNASAGWSI